MTSKESDIEADFSRGKASLWIRSKLIIDLLSGVAVIGTLVFIALQWHEMKTGSVDTHNLAIAAGNQAKASNDQSKTSASQLCEMEKALKRQDELIKQVTSQAKSANSLAASSARNAKAAEEAVREAKEEDRPWLGFVKFNPSTPVSGQVMHLDALVQNSGKSPAEMVLTSTWIGPHVGQLYAFSDIQLPLLAKPATESRAVLVPGEGYTPDDHHGKLSITDFRSIENGATDLYAIGYSTYRGINEPSSVEHHSSMCEVWMVKQKKWTLCGFMNDAD